MTTNDHLKSTEQLLVEKFMALMHHKMQPLPTAPEIPSLEVRKLRARLMLEEVHEIIELGFGLDVEYKTEKQHVSGVGERLETTFEFHESKTRQPDLAEIAGNLADLDVVGPLGTAAVCGLAMKPITQAVCGNNLLKFAPGHFFRPDGKLVKPPNHPKIESLIGILIEIQHDPHGYQQ